jgi:hypothetical protein
MLMRYWVGFVVVLALGVMGCTETSGADGSSGVGGDGGNGGEGGSGTAGTGGTAGHSGSGGEPGLPDGMYEFECQVAGLPIPVPFGIIIKRAEVIPSFAVGSESALTTQLGYRLGPDVFAPTPEPYEAMISDLRAVVAVVGTTPAEIDHTIEGLPLTARYKFDSDLVTTEPVVPESGASAVELSVSALHLLVTNLPEALVPDGEVEIVAGEGNCADLEPVEGSAPLVFPVGDRTRR